MRGRATIFGWNQVEGIVMCAPPPNSAWNDKGRNVYVCFPGGVFYGIDAAQFCKYPASILAEVWEKHRDALIDKFANKLSDPTYWYQSMHYAE